MKRSLLTVSGLLGLALAGHARTPNILYIITDQHSASALSCARSHGGEAERASALPVHTPAIDRIAERGVRFDNAYCAMPLSGPSRAAMFTGYMPGQCGMTDNGAVLPDSLSGRTLGTLMEDAGYATAYAGKWHVHTNSLPAPHSFGFERIHPQGDDGLADAVVDYLRKSKDSDRPFFVVASFDNPHNICQYARGQQLPEAEISIPADVRHCPPLPVNHLIGPNDPDILRWEREQSYRLYPTKGYSADDWRRYRAAYQGLVEHVDSLVGVIVDEVDRQNLWDNTIVIFTSDHGDGQGAHQWNQKTALWEECANVPLIVAMPGARSSAGKVSHKLINNGIDLMPSLLDAAGADIPAHCRGNSWLEAPTDVAAADDVPYVVTETVFNETAGTRGWMLRTPRYKYVLYEAGKGREALYDMETDRLEMRNLAVESGYDDVLRQHRQLLARWFDANPAGLPYSRRRFLPE